jgi:DNA-binding MarR family transcriptional regulator
MRRIFSPKQDRVLEVIAVFGYTFSEVLGKTIYKSQQSAIGEISKLVKKKVLKRERTGLASPQNLISLTPAGKQLVRDFLEIEPSKMNFAISRYKHNRLEQLAWLELIQIGEVIRTTVYQHKNIYYAVPDLMLITSTGDVHIEIEATIKSNHRYKNIQIKKAQDYPRAVLYICENKNQLKLIANKFGTWNKLMFIDIDKLHENIEKYNKVRAYTQEEILTS